MLSVDSVDGSQVLINVLRSDGTVSAVKVGEHGVRGGKDIGGGPLLGHWSAEVGGGGGSGTLQAPYLHFQRLDQII